MAALTTKVELMRSLVFAMMFAVYFFGCAMLQKKDANSRDFCIQTVLKNQLKATAEEAMACDSVECVQEIARQRSIIAAEYVKVCQ